MNNNIIIGFGGCGINIINSISSIKTNQHKLQAISKLDTINTSNDVDIMQVNSNTLDNIIKSISDYDKIYIINGIGGSHAKDLLLLIEDVINKNIKVDMTIIAINPFSWEGKTRSDLSKNILEKLKYFNISLKTFDNDEITDVGFKVIDVWITDTEAFGNSATILFQKI